VSQRRSSREGRRIVRPFSGSVAARDVGASARRTQYRAERVPVAGSTRGRSSLYGQLRSDRNDGAQRWRPRRALKKSEVATVPVCKVIGPLTFLGGFWTTSTTDDCRTSCSFAFNSRSLNRRNTGSNPNGHRPMFSWRGSSSSNPSRSSASRGALALYDTATARRCFARSCAGSSPHLRRHTSV
jgi:hypothetical protein